MAPEPLHFCLFFHPLWSKSCQSAANSSKNGPAKKIHAWIFLRGQLFLQLAASTHPSRQLGQPKSFMQKVFLFCKPQKRAPFENLGPFFCKQQLGYCLAPDKPKRRPPNKPRQKNLDTQQERTQARKLQISMGYNFQNCAGNTINKALQACPTQQGAAVCRRRRFK